MNRYITSYNIDTDTISACLASEADMAIIDGSDEWVCQFAKDKETAIDQHFSKHDEWSADPTKETY